MFFLRIGESMSHTSLHEFNLVSTSMTDTPLSSNDYGKLLVFALLLLPPVLFVVGIVPALFLLFGVFMMKKTSDFAHVETAVRNYKIYCSLIAFGFFLALGYFLFEYSRHVDSMSDWAKQRAAEDAVQALIGNMISMLYIVAVQYLVLKPLKAHRDWVATKGFFLNRSKQPVSVPKDIEIIKGERMRSFSVADELLKWGKLKDEGHITAEEFADARRKLLERP